MFIDEKIQELGILSAVPNQFTITNYSNRIVVLEGKIELLKITQTLINLSVSTHPLTISGTNLTLKNLDQHSLTIVGEIQNIN